LRENGATDEEINILVQGRWWGERIELNAMTSDQFIEWFDRKLEEHCVRKVIPESATLAAAYRRAVYLQKIDKAEEKLRKKMKGQSIEVPANLLERVNRIMSTKKGRDTPWDEVVWKIASLGEKALDLFDPGDGERASMPGSVV